MVDAAKVLPGDHEGWVVKFDDGFRVKIKGAEYLTLHKTHTGVTLHSIFKLVKSGKPREQICRTIPEGHLPRADEYLSKIYQDMEAVKQSAEEYYRDNNMVLMTIRNAAEQLVEFPGALKCIILAIGKSSPL